LPFFDSEKVTRQSLSLPGFSTTRPVRGALGGNRTRDLSLTKGVLYH
jgi:hypothetical protein